MAHPVTSVSSGSHRIIRQSGERGGVYVFKPSFNNNKTDTPGRATLRIRIGGDGMAKVIPFTHDALMEQPYQMTSMTLSEDDISEEVALLRQLTQWRESAGLSRAQVAERMGVKPPAISRLERNITRATWNTLRRYAEACGVKIALTNRP